MAKIPIAHKQDIKYPCLATWAKNAHSINTHWWIDWPHATSFIPFLSVPKGHALDVSRSDNLCLSRLSPNIQVTASASNTFWEFCRNWWHHCLQAVLSFQRKPCHQQRNWIWASAYACSGHQNLPGQPREIGKPNSHTNQSTLENVHTLWISGQLWIIHSSNFKIQWVNY